MAVLAAACTPKGAVLATVAGNPVTESDFRRHLARAHAPDEAHAILVDPARRQAALEAYFDRLAMAAKAHRLGLDGEARFAKAIELMEMKTLAHLLTERRRAHIETITHVSADEVRRFYDEHKGDYLDTPRFRARQVLVYVRGNPAFPEKGLPDAQARAQAEAALAQLRAGTGWNEVAERHSDDPSNGHRGGLIRDGRFGYYAPEVEAAVRTQELGKPGPVLKSAFGYHVVQVEERVLEATPEPFDKVERRLVERMTEERTLRARAAFIVPLAQKVGLTVHEAGKREASLLDERAVAPDAILAEVAGEPIRESDFRWFLKDAIIASQRTAAYARPGARQAMLTSYLDMRVLEANARKEGLHRGADFARQRYTMAHALLVEFVQEHDKAGPFCRCQETPEERHESERRYLAGVRREMGLRPTAIAAP